MLKSFTPAPPAHEQKPPSADTPPLPHGKKLQDPNLYCYNNEFRNVYMVVIQIIFCMHRMMSATTKQS